MVPLSGYPVIHGAVAIIAGVEIWSSSSLSLRYACRLPDFAYLLSHGHTSENFLVILLSV